MSRLLVPAVIAVLLLALGTITGACGGSEELTLEEYFQQVQAITDEQGEKSEALAQDFEKVFEEGDFEGLRDVYNTGLAIATDAFDEMDDIDPPAEAENAHNEFVDAGEAFWALLEGFVDQLADVKTEVEFEAAVNAVQDAGADAAEERFDTACSALQDIADENDIDVQLGCG